MCDRSGECSNEATCQLTLRHAATGLETVEYYCQAHLVCRVLEIEDESSLIAVDALRL